MSVNNRCKRKSNRQSNGSHSSKRRKMSPDLAKMEEAAAAEEEAGRSQKVFFSKKIKEMKGKVNTSRNQKKKLEDGVNELRKGIEKKSIQQNDAMTEGQNQKQGETICVFEYSAVKLQEELQEVEKVSNASSDENDKLHDEINELEKKMKKESIEENDAPKSQNQILPGETIGVQQLSIHRLQEELKEIKEANNQLRTENAKRKKEIETLQRNVKKLTDKFASVTESNKSLEKTVKKQQKIETKLKDMETKLALGQVALCLEKEIWKAVLPGIKMGTTRIFKCMKEWLHENATSTEGKEAQTRWNKLKDELKWKDRKHKFGLKLLKGVRNPQAHPEEVDYEKARKELKDHIAVPFQKRCEEIIDMVIKAEQWNSSKSI